MRCHSFGMKAACVGRPYRHGQFLILGGFLAAHRLVTMILVRAVQTKRPPASTTASGHGDFAAVGAVSKVSSLTGCYIAHSLRGTGHSSKRLASSSPGKISAAGSHLSERPSL